MQTSKFNLNQTKIKIIKIDQIVVFSPLKLNQTEININPFLN